MNLFGWLPRLGPQLNPVQQKLAELESQLATAQKRLEESITIAATPVSPLDRFVDGDRYLVPGGTRQDRQWGSNRPVLNQQWDLNQMRTNARLLLDANGFAIGGMDRLIDFVVGEGFKREITLRDAEPGATSDTEDPLIRQVTMLLDDWCKKYEWGHGEEDREAETFKRTSRDGEVFTRVDKDEESDSWMPWIRFVEPEHVYTPPDESQMSEWSWGILTKKGDVETRLAYWVGDPKAQTQAGDPVDAADIFHHKVNTDRTIKRGISDFFPVFDTFESARKILRNMGEVAAIQAAIAWIRQHAATTTADQVQRMIDRTKNYDQTNMRPVFPQGPDNTQPVTFTEPGQVLDMSNGMQYLAGPSATGSPGFIQVLQATLRGAGARWGAPEFFSGDASNNNFASILVSGSPFERYAKRRQSAFSAYQERIFYRVLEYAEKAGKVPPGTCGRIKIRCIPPAVAIANRNEDEQIRAQQNQAGVLSRTTWQRQVNLDPKIEAENFRREKEEDAQGQQQQDGLGQGAQSPGFESVTYTQSQYKRLSEGARSGLVKKRITNRVGNQQTVWVRTSGKQPATPTTPHAETPPADPAPSATDATGSTLSTMFGKARDLGNKAMNTKVGRVLSAVEHKLSIAAHKTREVAVKAAELRGLDEGQAQKLKNSLALADFFGGYVSGAAAGAVAGPIGAKVAMFMPSASAVYLAYSTAQDPVATWKAALQVVEESSIDPRHVASAFSKAWFAAESAYDWVDQLADLLNADEDVADWTQALFLVALAVTHDPEQAVAFAGQHSTDDGSMEESRQVTATGELLEEGRNLSGLSKVKRTDRNGVSRYVYVRTGGDEGSTPKKAGQRSEAEHAAHVAELTATAQKIKSGKHTPEELKSFTDGLSKLTVAEIVSIKQQVGVKGGKLKAEHIKRVVAFTEDPQAATKYKAAKTGDSLSRVVASYGGIDPESLDFLKHYEGVSQALEHGISLGVFRKGGRGLDTLAEELYGSGHIHYGENEDPGQHLLQQLAKKAKILGADLTSDYEKAYEEHARATHEASQQYDPASVARSARIGEEAGYAEAEDRAKQERASSVWGTSKRSNPASAGQKSEVDDTSFEFGANATKSVLPVKLANYHAGDETEATSKQLFGHVPSSQDFARVGCAVNGGSVAVDGYVDEGSAVVVIMGSYDGQGGNGEHKTGMRSSREIYRDRNGKLTCENYSFQNESDVTGVSGTELFRDQVETLRNIGVEQITTYGAGNKELAAMDEGKSNGYYTWPRLGYSGEMSESQFAKLPPDIQTAMGDSRDVRTLFESVPGGPEAWKEYGEGLSLTFDLAPGSVNMVALEKYLTKRGLR